MFKSNNYKKLYISCNDSLQLQIFAQTQVRLWWWFDNENGLE